MPAAQENARVKNKKIMNDGIKKDKLLNVIYRKIHFNRKRQVGE
jgi:hypothetical protein